ncbi:MAG TPA: glycoside hydrolase family 3 protein [Ktedonobacterales bacterium]|jgi:beta-N-acetylhexosaminidase
MERATAFARRPARAPRRPVARRVRGGALALALVAMLLAACGRGIRQDTVRELQSHTSASDTALALVAKLRQQQTSGEAAARERLLQMEAANWYLARLSLDDQIGQMLMNEFADGGVYLPDTAVMVEQQHIGGVIVFGTNYGTFDQTRTQFQQMQAHSPIPLIIATDQEGGAVSRVGQYFGGFPWARELAASGDPNYAYQWGQRTALDLQQLGINADFAPVVDVAMNGAGYLGWRTFSDDPTVVGTYAGAYIRGAQSVGEITALKHYPGLGGVNEDPHDLLPVNPRTLDDLRQVELQPYKTLIPQHPDMIMTTDLLLPKIDATQPAEFSPTLITTILRGELGYDGVVVSDALWMGGVCHNVRGSCTYQELGENTIRAIVAGCDMMIATYNSASSQVIINMVHDAVNSGRISRARIATSVQRLLMLKVKYGMLPIPPAVLAQQPLTQP